MVQVNKTGNAQGEEEMKKLMLMVGVAMVAVAMFAAGKEVWSGAYNVEVNRLMLEKNYAAARAYIDDFDWGSTQAAASAYVQNVLRIDVAERKPVASLDDLKAQIGTLAVKAGLTDRDLIDYLIIAQAYSRIENKQVGYDFYKSIANPTDAMKALAVNYCLALKKYDEALSLALGVGNYNTASQIAAMNLKDKAKTFEYCKKAMLDQYCTAPILVYLLDRVGGFDYADTSVTKDMQKDLLLAVDLKYRRFLVKDKATWEPIIAGIRLTLQGYGVEVK